MRKKSVNSIKVICIVFTVITLTACNKIDKEITENSKKKQIENYTSMVQKLKIETLDNIDYELSKLEDMNTDFFYFGRETCQICLSTVENVRESFGEQLSEVYYIDTDAQSDKAGKELLLNNYNIEFVPTILARTSNGDIFQLDVESKMLKKQVDELR